MEDYYGMNQIGECAPKAGLVPYKKPTTRERLLEQRTALKERLSKVDQTLEALDKFPEFEKIHNLLSEVL